MLKLMRGEGIVSNHISDGLEGVEWRLELCYVGDGCITDNYFGHCDRKEVPSFLIKYTGRLDRAWA